MLNIYCRESFLTGTVHLLDIFVVHKTELETISKGLATWLPQSWVPNSQVSPATVSLKGCYSTFASEGEKEMSSFILRPSDLNVWIYQLSYYRGMFV